MRWGPRVLSQGLLRVEVGPACDTWLGFPRIEAGAVRVEARATRAGGDAC